MKPALLACMAALLLLSGTGCSAILNRDYTHVTPHNTTSPTTGDPSILRAESYQELVNALVYFIGQGTETGTIRLYMDTESVDTILENACLEVVQEDALGAYAVEYIKYSVSSVVTYAQADVQITYRRTREQVGSIVSVTGVTAIRRELQSALTTFAPEQVLRISYFDGDSDYILDLVREAYYASPGSALGMPQAEVFIYPDSGRQRIVEILLTYPLAVPELEQRRDLLEETARTLCQPLSVLRGDQALLSAAQTVGGGGGHPNTRGRPPHDAPQPGGAASAGLGQAQTMLGQQLGLSCRVVPGTLEGQPHFWNVVEAEDGWRHVDVSRLSSAELPLCTDEDFSGQGYLWDSESVPLCG